MGRRNIPISWSTWEAWSQKILWSWMTSSSLKKQLFNRETWIPSLLWLMSCNWKFSWDQMLRKMLKKILYWKKNLCKKQIIPPLKKKKTSSEIILLLKTEFNENIVSGSLGKESVKCLARRELWTLQSCTHLQNLWNCYQVKICSDSAQTQETLTKLTNMYQKWTVNVSEFSETFSFL